MINLFNHQNLIINDIYSTIHAGARNICAVLPTGAGKTIVKAFITMQYRNLGKTVIAFAHRDVLLGQISDAMCLAGVRHSFIAANKTVKDITNANKIKHGDSFYDETSPVIVASVDTFLNRLKNDSAKALCENIDLWLMDETHHLLADNKWGRCVTPLVNAIGIGVTATPIRGDNKGLGRHADGVFDELVVGATMGELIEAKRLSPYKIFVPPTRVDVSGVNVTSSGDYNQRQLAKVTDKASITGDAVEHYLRLADGLQAITFCVNIAHSEHVAAAFNKAGIPSKAVSSKTPLAERTKAIEDFKAGRILNLCNADLFGEGFDVPACSVAIMLRKTQSYSLFKQQFGRALRWLDTKPFGILIDHVGNVPDMLRKYNLEHPHDDPEWTLDRQTKRKRGTGEEPPAGRVCPECANYYIPQNGAKVCPECAHEETPEEQEDAHKKFLAKEGNLIELSNDMMTNLIAKRAEVDTPIDQFAQKMQHAPAVVRHSAVNRHVKRQHAQNRLRSLIQDWCTVNGESTGWSVSMVQQQFEATFGVNILKAQVMSERESLELIEAINHER